LDLEKESYKVNLIGDEKFIKIKKGKNSKLYEIKCREITIVSTLNPNNI
jgi:hypothetical protein